MSTVSDWLDQNLGENSTAGQYLDQLSGGSDNHGNPIAQAWQLATSYYHIASDYISGQGSADMEVHSPHSAPSTLAQTNTTAVQNQLSGERQSANANSILTGGAGLLDQPTVSNLTLHGS